MVSQFTCFFHALTFKFDSGVGELAQDVENAGISAGLLAEFVAEHIGIEGADETVQAKDGDAKAGGIEQVSMSSWPAQDARRAAVVRS